VYKIVVYRINSKYNHKWILFTDYLGTDPSRIGSLFYNKYGNADWWLVKRAIGEELWHFTNGTNFWCRMIEELDRGTRFSICHGSLCGFIIEKVK
jgi:hypothetical protein